MLRRRLAAITLGPASFVASTPGQAGAITFGQLDGNRHPNVGAQFIPPPDPGEIVQWGSGSLLAPRVFLTGAPAPARPLGKAWPQLDMNPSTGSGGTCYGDSGGPHFLGGPKSNLEVSLTVTGDAYCRATDTTYRLATRSARALLDDHGGHPRPPPA